MLGRSLGKLVALVTQETMHRDQPGATKPQHSLVLPGGPCPFSVMNGVLKYCKYCIGALTVMVAAWLPATSHIVHSSGGCCEP